MASNKNFNLKEKPWLWKLNFPISICLNKSNGQASACDSWILLTVYSSSVCIIILKIVCRYYWGIGLSISSNHSDSHGSYCGLLLHCNWSCWKVIFSILMLLPSCIVAINLTWNQDVYWPCHAFFKWYCSLDNKHLFAYNSLHIFKFVIHLWKHILLNQLKTYCHAWRVVLDVW